LVIVEVLNFDLAYVECELISRGLRWEKVEVRGFGEVSQLEFVSSKAKFTGCLIHSEAFRRLIRNASVVTIAEWIALHSGQAERLGSSWFHLDFPGYSSSAPRSGANPSPMLA
jgi:hypothetical protein